MTEPLLSVRDLHVDFHYKKRIQPIIRGVSFEVYPGRCLGILGESGSGKSMSLKAVMGLLDRSFSVTGEAFYQGKDLLKQSKEQLRSIRGRKLCMILQNPMTCFDPLYRIEYQMAETYSGHFNIGKEEIYKRSLRVLESMQIRNPQEVLKKYPHQLSGGMLQRIMIGLAVSMEPDMLIADEPTTAIDAITQFEIMKEFVRIKKESKMAMVFISHDLGVISQIADEVLVMNRGKVADRGSFCEIMENAADPYTRLLVKKKRAVMARYREAMEGKKVGSV
ncbi:MAG: ABC transporter ATP-binding protein [Clostridium sp.]|nr:ABC transporter ATP-binding protein [Clostridium sp.]